MLNGSSDLRIKTNNIEQDEKFTSKRLSRETSMTNSSLEVYYGGSSVAVPFMWESQPGTPKFRSRDTPLPPLTPPPSSHSTPAKTPIKKHSKSSLFRNVLPKLGPRKTNSPRSPASSPSSSSSSSWSPRRPSSHSVPSPSTRNLREHFPSPRFSFDSRVDGEEDDDESPASTSCCGLRGASSHRDASDGFNVLNMMFLQLLQNITSPMGMVGILFLSQGRVVISVGCNKIG
ncbi:hypothetical protein RJ639_043295 [Escallonia herrerae]|uniref:Uncharacterized protein n=1 Tax=Escallonia herrerae TaxID=1293975 RepID=A0AA89B8P1_9ASTE|nr:hypothetical protein RJ639_043295 [Escallonia herrerae]